MTIISTHLQEILHYVPIELLHPLKRVRSPWAVLLVKFADDPDEGPDRAIYEKLFTSEGKGTLNMPEFFEDMSLGTLDLWGSKVFGWFTLDVNRSDYDNAKHDGVVHDRNWLVNRCKALGTGSGVDLGDFAGVVISMPGQTDLFGMVGGMTAFCDVYSLQPSLLGQEMGHGYGLDHARRNGSGADYQDPWDIMSTAVWPNMESDDPDYTHVGPGLNAWCMRSRGWLDEDRVWSDSGTYEGEVTLRPLHARELSGLLAAQIGEYLVEFRVPEKWDASIGDACVLVHRFEDNHSYLMPGTAGELSLVTGTAFEFGNRKWPFAEYGRVEVASIDAESKRAVLHLTHRTARHIEVPTEVGTIFGGVAVDGPGILVLPGGHIVKVPPRGPIMDLVTRVGELAEHRLTRDIGAGRAQRRALVESIVVACQRIYEENDVFSEPPPMAPDRDRRR